MRVERVREYQTEGATRTAQQRAPRMQQVAVAEGEQALVHQAAHRPRLLRRVAGQRQRRRMSQEQRHHGRLEPRADRVGHLVRPAAAATAAVRMAACRTATVTGIGAAATDVVGAIDFVSNADDSAAASDGGGGDLRLGE